MLAWFELYFNTFPDHEDIQVPELKWLIEQRAGSSSPEAVAITLHYADLLNQEVDPGTIKGVIDTLYDLDYTGRVGALLAAYDRGEDVDIVHAVSELTAQVKRAKSNGKSSEFLDLRIGDILSEIADDRGIKLFSFLPTFAKGVAAMQGGASVAVGMRPDKGKTSLVAKGLANAAPQCIKYFGPDRPILWLNNEGSGKRILPRAYQAALGLTLEEIIKLSNEGVLEQRYMEALGTTDLHFIRVKDVHGASLAQVEQIIEEMKPSVVVYDMLANFKMALGTGNKTDAVEQAWQTVREYAVLHDHIAISTVQVSADGDNTLFPMYSALKDSKTGIQGATDLIVMGGALNDPRYQEIIGLSTPKNKFSVTGVPSYLQFQATFNKSICDFQEMEGTS